jgi:hypothetical protein
MNGDLKVAIDEWIVRATLEGSDERVILAGIGDRLNEAGVPVLRAAVAANLLDPTTPPRRPAPRPGRTEE